MRFFSSFCQKVWGNFLLLLFGIFFFSQPLFAQKKEKIDFKDEKDGKLDLSDWIIDAKGFIPIPTLITEPALGGIGGALGLAFLSQVPNSPPNITGVMAGVTGNNTWFLGGLHSHHIPEKGIRYRIGGGYGDVNISLYRDLPVVGEQEFKFNFKMLPIYFRGTKQLGDSRWNMGIYYLFLHNEVGFNGDIPSFITDQELDSRISLLGPIVEFDSRDNVFTPNRGLKFEGSWGLSESWLGSDYSYSRLTLAGYSYWPVKTNWVLGLRAEYQEIFDQPPFFMLPAINLRGIPAGRFQGNQTMLTEVENRIDVSYRWSVMAFGGLAKAFDGFDDFGDTDLAYSVGTGFRYFIARKFGLRMGMDVAVGPDSWGYYIVFGSNWLR
ncbi:BamA/TamA family outer membrane protein [Algoriphagus namhaensis]